MTLLGKTAAVIARNSRNHQMLRFRIAEQLAMTNEIPGMLVISTEIDVLTTGMQHCRCPKQIPTTSIILMKNTMCVVVKAECMAGYTLCTAVIHCKTLHLMNHGALTNTALKTKAILQ